MRLRERKYVIYETSGSDESGACSLPARRNLQYSAGELSDSDASNEHQIVEELCVQHDNWEADKRVKDFQIPLRHGEQESSVLDEERPASGDLYTMSKLDDQKNSNEEDLQNRRYGTRSRKTAITNQNALATSALKPRATRSVRVNYCEDSCSEASGKEEENDYDEQHDNQSSDVSLLEPDSPRLRRQCDKGSNTGLDHAVMSTDVAIEDGIASDEDLGLEKTEVNVSRRSTKLPDPQILETEDFSDDLFSKTAREVEMEDAECLHTSIAEQPFNETDPNRGVCANQLRTYTRKAVGQPEVLSECTSEFGSEKAENEFALPGPSLSALNGRPGSTSEIEFLPYTYVRRRKGLKLKSSGHAEVVTNKLNKDQSLPQLKVDKFGPFTDENGDRPVVKKVGLVEKILSVKKHATSTVYCVKLSGKSYRNAAYVSESLLLKDSPQLLRHFLRRLDDLHRIDGNLGDKVDSPAFNPLYVQVDRIIGAEQRGRKKCYLVKWRGLPYSESTWEPEDSLLGDKNAIKRFSQIDTKGAPTSSSSTFKDGRILRDYQKKGLAWMDHNCRKHVNCILADEMGLGKTMQSVAMLQNLRVKMKIKGPFLVVAPVSTLGHWQREIESLTDMNCVVYSGSMEDRNIIKEYEFYSSSGKTHDLKFNVLVTGYEILMKDHFFLSKHEWQYIIVDEAHRLKTKHSKTSRTLKEMSVRKGGLLLLTGTPVQNNTKEIFSLLNLLDPHLFNSEEEFLLKYGDIKNVEQVRDLQENVLKPRLLRRMKEDVEKSIPLKEETIIWVELTQDQRSYYRAILENRISDLLKGSQASNVPNLRNIAMELRKLCNHPFLCEGLEEHLLSKYNHGGQQKIQGEGRLELPWKVLCQSSGKMLLLDKLLPMLKDAGRRVLIFSQFTMLLDLLEDYLNTKGYSFERIDGKIRGSERQAAIDRYSARGSETFVFLLSTRAGGLGITLTAADTCIIYDSDWNPQNDLQAMARCHRIGQTKDVRIYRLITRNTYEQHLFECSSRKYGLDEAILGNILGSSGDIEESKTIESLLRRGAYDMLKDDGEAEAAAFHAQNIDQILEQRTQKRLIGGRGNNTFSVATFISNPDIQPDEVDDKDNNPSVNLESAQFWQELLPDAFHASLNAEKPQEFTSAGPRRRAQVNYKEKGEISDEGSSDEEKKSEIKKRSAANKRNRDVDVEDGVKQWSEREVKQLENRLIMLGKGREEQVMMEAGLEHRGITEVQQLAETLIQFCLYFQEKGSLPVLSKEADSNAQEQAGLQCMPGSNLVEKAPQSIEVGFEGASRECWQHEEDAKMLEGNPSMQASPNHSDKEDAKIRNKECPRIPPFAQKALASQSCMVRLQKNALRYLQILHERDVLSKALSSSNFSPVSISRSKKLPQWWGEVEDLNLMIGALKHGHKDFPKIREDPNLCFVAKLNAKKCSVDNELALATQTSISTPELLQSPEIQDQVQNDEWPNDSVLTMRLKKLIECLPNGLSDREIKRRAAVSEASRKRFQELRLTKQGQEMIALSSQDFETIQVGYVLYIDGCRFEQSEFKTVHSKVDIAGMDSRNNFTGMAKENVNQEHRFTHMEYKVPTSPVRSFQVPLVQQKFNQNLWPDAMPRSQLSGSMVGESNDHSRNFLNKSMLISNQLLNGQPSDAIRNPWLNAPQFCTNQAITSDHELVTSNSQHKRANNDRAYEASPAPNFHMENCTPVGLFGVPLMQWLPVGASAIGVSVGLNNDELQEYNWPKRRAESLVSNANKRAKDCGGDMGRQERLPETFISDISMSLPEL